MPDSASHSVSEVLSSPGYTSGYRKRTVLRRGVAAELADAADVPRARRGNAAVARRTRPRRRRRAGGLADIHHQHPGRTTLCDSPCRSHS